MFILINSVVVIKNKVFIKDVLVKGGELLYGNFDVVEKSDMRMKLVVIINVNREMEIY